MAVKEIVQVLLKYTTEGAAKANAAAKSVNEQVTKQQREMQDANKTAKRGIEDTRNNTIANSKAGQVMRMNTEALGRYNKEGKQFTNRGARMANRFRMMTHGARGFRMEMLGVMFFGMAMQRVLFGLLKTSKEWTGVNEILSTALGVLFLPIAEKLLEWALKFLNWVDQLSEKEKKTIGWFVLVGGAVGTLLFLIGTLSLGIGSMILAFNFSKVATIVGSLGQVGASATAAATKVATLKSILGKTILVAVGISIAWAGFTYIKKGIDEGSLLKEIIGVLLMGIGLGTAGGALGLTLLGVSSGVIGFTLGIGIGLIISWTIQKNKYESDLAKRMAEKQFGTATAVEAVSRGFSPTGGQGTYMGVESTPTLSSFQNMNISSSLIGAGRTGNVTVSPTYNITIPDKKEFEDMLERNNRDMVNEFRR